MYPKKMSWELFSLRIYKKILINLPGCTMYDYKYTEKIHIIVKSTKHILTHTHTYIYIYIYPS